MFTEKSEKRKENYIMADKIIENNQVSIMGKIVTGFTFSHQVYGEGFYTMELLVKRLSESEDRIPVMVSERLVDVTQDYVGQYVEIHGQFRSYNRHEEKHNRLVLSAFARELKFVEDEEEGIPVNQIFLDGYICKPPVYRKTPLGREIADLLLAVNRPYSMADTMLLCRIQFLFKVGRTDDSHKAAPPVDIEYPGFPFGEFLKSLPVLRCIYLFESDMVVHIYRDRFHAVMGGRIFDEERLFTVFSLVHDMPSAVIEQEARVLHAAENVCVVRDA